MEVKSGEGTVVVADRNRIVMNVVIIEDGVPVGVLSGGALVGGGFGAGAGFNRVMDRLCQMEHQQSNCCCEIKSLIRESENRLALQAERNHCEVMKGQQEIKCLIENTAKDQEIARLNRVVDAQRDQNIINSVVQALGNKTA